MADRQIVDDVFRGLWTCDGCGMVFREQEPVPKHPKLDPPDGWFRMDQWWRKPYTHYRLVATYCSVACIQSGVKALSDG